MGKIILKLCTSNSKYRSNDIRKYPNPTSYCAMNWTHTSL